MESIVKKRQSNSTQKTHIYVQICVSWFCISKYSKLNIFFYFSPIDIDDRNFPKWETSEEKWELLCVSNQRRTVRRLTRRYRDHYHSKSSKFNRNAVWTVIGQRETRCFVFLVFSPLFSCNFRDLFRSF